jgi:hypothetical protein
MRLWAPGADRDLSATNQRIRVMNLHWREHGFGDWGLFERATNELIGFAGLHHILDMEEVNIGYVIAQSRWRRGYALEACRSALEVGSAAWVWRPSSPSSLPQMVHRGSWPEGSVSATGSECAGRGTIAWCTEFAPS